MRWVFASFLLLAVSCAGVSATSHPKTLYTSFGAAAPGVDEEIIGKWKSSRELLVRNAKAPETKVKTTTGRLTTVAALAQPRIEALRLVNVLVDTVPEGIELERGSAKVTANAGYVLLGHFSMRYESERPLSEALDDVKVLATAAEGNLAIISWERSEQQAAKGVVGLIFRRESSAPLDPSQLRGGKVTDI